ncbi:MAG: amidohydrolase family protein, partial [Actinobacteria bacterium]|nr:amidohydrolase family protein [Actinomycetota bacterium]
MIIDAHAHVCSPDEAAYRPIENPRRPPAGTGGTDHLRTARQRAGVDKAVLVQNSSFYGWDNSFLRDVAAQSAGWAVGCCTLSADHPHTPDILYALVHRSNARAVRSTEAAAGRYGDPAVRWLYAAARECGIAINVLVTPELVEQLAAVAATYPEVPVVLDHCLGLKAGAGLKSTLGKVTALARLPNVHAKLTFVPTGSAKEAPFRDMHDAVLRVIDASLRRKWLRIALGLRFPTVNTRRSLRMPFPGRCRGLGICGPRLGWRRDRLHLWDG